MPSVGQVPIMPDIERLTTERNIGGLIEILASGDVYRGLKAVYALGSIGEPAVDPLMGILRDGHRDVRWGAAMALARIGPPALDSLIGTLQLQDPQVRNPIIWAISEIGDARAVQPLVQVLRDDTSETCRALTAAALLKIGDPEGVLEVQREFERHGEPFVGYVMEAYEGS